MTSIGLSRDRSTPLLFATLRGSAGKEAFRDTQPQTALPWPDLLIGACLFLSENSLRKLFQMSFRVGGQIAFYYLPLRRIEELSYFPVSFIAKTVITGRSMALSNFLRRDAQALRGVS